MQDVGAVKNCVTRKRTNFSSAHRNHLVPAIKCDMTMSTVRHGRRQRHKHLRNYTRAFIWSLWYIRVTNLKPARRKKIY